jgi:hypothetical protein
VHVEDAEISVGDANGHGCSSVNRVWGGSVQG